VGHITQAWLRSKVIFIKGLVTFQIASLRMRVYFSWLLHDKMIIEQWTMNALLSLIKTPKNIIFLLVVKGNR
jgi:hypothetical protein